jgi:lysozyme family protein
MADANFAPCLAFVLAAEGGYVDDPLDPGGATNLGITLNLLTDWRHSAVTKQDVMNLNRDEAAAIYRARYWNVVRGGSLPAGVDLMVFDAAVNLGAGRSALILQAIVGTPQDGSIGPVTVAAVVAASPTDTIGALATKRSDYYHSLSTFDHFGAGWIKRVTNAKAVAFEMTQSA